MQPATNIQTPAGLLIGPPAAVKPVLPYDDKPKYGPASEPGFKGLRLRRITLKEAVNIYSTDGAHDTTSFVGESMNRAPDKGMWRIVTDEMAWVHIWHARVGKPILVPLGNVKFCEPEPPAED